MDMIRASKSQYDVYASEIVRKGAAKLESSPPPGAADVASDAANEALKAMQDRDSVEHDKAGNREHRRGWNGGA